MKHKLGFFDHESNYFECAVIPSGTDPRELVEREETIRLT
jgi:hypothetical protein